MKVTRNIILLCLCSLTTKLAFAFSPEVAHEPLTRLAFYAYSQCTGDTTTYPYKTEKEKVTPGALQERIVLGNRAMDDGPKNLSYEDMEAYSAEMLFSYGQRPFNWHFYNPNNNSTDHTKQGLVEKSQRNLWSRARDGLTSIEGANNKAIYLGAMIHLLEDMGVPAHVVPVYHGPKLPWWIGNFDPVTNYIKDDKRYTDSGLLFKDPLDDIAPDEDKLRVEFETVFSATSEFCKSVVNENVTPDRIRNDLAGDTLGSLNKPINECGNVTWGVFWNNDIKEGRNPYFMGYNLNVPEFNDKGLVTQKGVVGSCKMKKCDDRYSDFVLNRHLDTIKADVRLLNWAKKHMQQ